MITITQNHNHKTNQQKLKVSFFFKKYPNQYHVFLSPREKKGVLNLPHSKSWQIILLYFKILT